MQSLTVPSVIPCESLANGWEMGSIRTGKRRHIRFCAAARAPHDQDAADFPPDQQVHGRLPEHHRCVRYRLVPRSQPRLVHRHHVPVLVRRHVWRHWTWSAHAPLGARAHFAREKVHQGYWKRGTRHRIRVMLSIKEGPLTDDFPARSLTRSFTGATSSSSWERSPSTPVSSTTTSFRSRSTSDRRSGGGPRT